MTTPPTLSRLRLRVTPTAEARLRGGHPWLYEGSVREQNRPGAAGELAVVFDRRDKFLAVGLFDPASPLRLRVLHAGRPQEIDAAWWAGRLDAALERRAGLFGSDTDGYRMINGESDGWPGLVLDRYADVLVLKLYTAAWFPHLGTLLPLFEARLGAGSVVLRLSRNVQEAAGAFGLSDGAVLAGELTEGPVIFNESGLRFGADVVRGQKTGFFLDQRDNRRLIGELAAGRRVLNAFSFSGGFSLYAARGGAVSAVSLDISAHALAAARHNFALNAHLPGVAACQHETARADVFAWLAGTQRSFDLIVLDPPSLARREGEREGAVRAYARLADLALSRLEAGGVLVAASCSAHVSEQEFFAAVRGVAVRSGRAWRELMTTGHAPDHPVSFPEARYLKAIYLAFGERPV